MSSFTEKDILCTGFSIRAPESKDVPEFYNNLKTKKDMTVESRRYPQGYCGLPPRAGNLPQDTLNAFDFSFFKYGRKQADNMDVGVRTLLEVCQEALLDAKLDIRSLRGSRTGVYIGCGWVDSLSRSKGKSELTGYEIVNGYPSMTANKISFFFDFKGPSVTLDAACSSSMCALSQAYDDLNSGKVDRAIVGGVSITTDPNVNRMFNAYTMLSPTGRCHSFDARADGYCRSEGIGALVLESCRVMPEYARFGYAQLKGVSTSSSGHMKEGITFPSADAQAELAKEVLAMSKVNAEDICYVEAHGTGTRVGDRIELEGLSKVYPQHGMPIGSVKSNMGHAECASGTMAMIKLMIMYEKKQFLPNINYEQKNTPHELLQSGKFVVPTEVADWTPGNTIVMNYGFGGTNGVACWAPGNLNISAKAPLLKPVTDVPSLVFGSEEKAVEDFAKNLDENQAQWFSEQCALGNDHAYKARAIGHVSKLAEKKNSGTENTVSEPETEEAAVAEVEPVKVSSVPTDTKICFLLNGQGSQWPMMGAKLMVDEPIFRETIERLNGFLPEHIDLVKMYKEGDQWLNKKYTVIGLVSYHMALINIMKARGITPDFYMGHSLGETACGYLAGFQTEEQTIKIAMMRSDIVQTIRKGFSYLVSKNEKDFEKVLFEGEVVLDAHQNFVYYVPDGYVAQGEDEFVWDMHGLMQAWGMPAKELDEIIKELGLTQTRVACLNSPSGQTVSGPEKEMRKLEEFVKAKNPNVFIRDIQTDSVAYHACYFESFYPLMHSVLHKIVGDCDAELPKEWLCTSGNDKFHAGFHARNVMNPVFFQEQIESLPAGTIIIECGPAQGMLAQVKRIRKDVVPFPLVKPGTPEDFTNLCRDLWLKGGLVRWSNVDYSHRFPLESRYPALFDHSVEMPAWTHVDYPLFGKSDTNSYQVKFDLQGDWKNIRGHRVCGRVLLPATSYIYAVWEARKFEPSEILDLKIHGALDISEDMKEVKLTVAWDEEGNYRVLFKDELKVTCRAKESVSEVTLPAPNYGTPAVLSEDEKTGEKVLADYSLDEKFAISGKELYPYIQMHGYEYQGAYRRIGKYDNENAACEMVESEDWISYFDGLLHLLVFGVESNLLPTGFGRVILNNVKDVKDADVWAVCNTGTKRLGNSTVVIENWSMDPGFGASPGPTPTENATGFLAYGKNSAKDLPFLGQALKWDCEGYRLALPEGGDVDFASRVASFLSPEIDAIPEADDANCPKSAVILNLSENSSPSNAVRKALDKPFSFLIVNGERLPPELASGLFDCTPLLSFSPLELESSHSDDDHSTAPSTQPNQNPLIQVTVYRRRNKEDYTWTDDWKQIQKEGKGETVVEDGEEKQVNVKKMVFFNRQKGAGVLGFTRTLQKEMWGDVYGAYFSDPVLAESPAIRKKVEELGMRLTYIKPTGEPGCLIERPLADEVSGNKDDTAGKQFHLRVARPGNLDSFQWEETSATHEVAFAALNFRDVMRAFARLKEVDMSVGLEFSGYEGPERKRVAGIGKKCIGTHCNAVFTIPVPDDISLEEAATIPICYLTAYHALFDKANLKKGDSVLIHAGAGGVGMAAISICQKRGIEVFTTCSAGKRQFVKDRFGLDDNHIANSRDASFKTQILEQTNGNGVTCVLNSLAGDLLFASVECVSAGGHFCEIGKADIMSNTGLGLRLLERNVSFHVIDLMQLWGLPVVQERWRKHIADGFASGEIVPLPTHTFAPPEVKDAFRFMSQGKHLGKVLLNMENGITTNANNKKPEAKVPKYFTKGRHLISGGLGGFALELAKRLNDRGAEELLLLGRSGADRLSPWQRRQLARLDCKVTIVKGAVQDLKVDQIGELETIWHTATLYRDAVFDNQNEDDWNAVVSAKIDGYLNLRKNWPDTRIVNFTSVVGGHGNNGQANYSFANEGVERASDDDKTLNIEWGFVGNVGQAAQMADGQISGAGYQPERVSDLLDFLDHVPVNQYGTVARYALEGADGDEDLGPVSLENLLAHIAEVLGGSAGDYDPTKPLEVFGLDSLSLTEIFSWVNRRCSKPMKATGTATVQVIMAHLEKHQK